jgi:hypothetical protein
VVGVSLGQGSVIYFVPGNKGVRDEAMQNNFAEHPEGFGDSVGATRLHKTAQTFALEIELPRRSIYVVSGAVGLYKLNPVDPQL